MVYFCQIDYCVLSFSAGKFLLGRMVRFDLIFCMRHKIFKFEKKEKPQSLRIQFYPQASKKKKKKKKKRKKTKKKKLCSSARCYSCENHRSQRHVCLANGEVFFAFSKSFGRKSRKKRFLFHPRCERERERRDDDVSSSSSEEKFCRWRKRRKEDE